MNNFLYLLIAVFIFIIAALLIYGYAFVNGSYSDTSDYVICVIVLFGFSCLWIVTLPITLSSLLIWFLLKKIKKYVDKLIIKLYGKYIGADSFIVSILDPSDYSFTYYKNDEEIDTIFTEWSYNFPLGEYIKLK